MTSAPVIAMFLLLTTTGLAAANKDWGYGGGNNGGWGGGGFPRHRPVEDHYSPRKVVVGGNQTSWQFGFDYTNWAIRNGPFFVNDTLVFKYEMPADNSSRPHSVYQLPDLRSFLRCDVSKGKMLANWTDGAGEGFEFVMDKWQPYFFACGEANGIHCNIGKMKFFVIPFLRRWNF
ncbi:unnamed protein product [Linum trigynum]|uniref:Phytocyanin domain-containing protein n=1 Tax=Linum trigynum TaxID=586398 RepID=A0AAV2ETY3_9ROSI